ncbi:uncharacterized protein LOC135486891 [Lineus longissimus]|uniref:uncharacterized protein LOC135486891 n=1 Tax=Lineus longissimus TaxID=88925 RepID=UPI00315D64DA
MKLLILTTIAAILYQACSEKNEEGQSHWCCNIELKPSVKEEMVLKPVRKTKLITKKVIVDYEPCDDEYDEEIFSRSCPVYETKKDEIAYYIMKKILEKTTVKEPCPDANIVCCGDLVLFEDNCYEASKIDQLKMLKELGIIGK